ASAPSAHCAGTAVGAPQWDTLSLARLVGLSPYVRAPDDRRGASDHRVRLALWLESRVTRRIGSIMRLFPTTIAGSLPKPAWLAEPNKLWAPWRISGAELADAKRDATLLALKLQEDSGI